MRRIVLILTALTFGMTPAVAQADPPPTKVAEQHAESTVRLACEDQIQAGSVRWCGKPFAVEKGRGEHHIRFAVVERMTRKSSGRKYSCIFMVVTAYRNGDPSQGINSKILKKPRCRAM